LTEILPSSFQDSKQTDIELREEVRRMRCPSCDADSDIPQKTENLFADVARAVFHQSDGIVVGKFLRTSQLVQIRKEHRVDMVEENIGIDGRLSMRFQNKVCAETHTLLPSLFSDGVWNNTFFHCYNTGNE
jgi:hypothetical protein